MTTPVRALSDDRLLEALDRMGARDRRFTVKQLALLIEADRRKLAEKRAYSSLFQFCVQRLKLSESMAYWRIRSARASQKYPEIMPALESGQLNITTVALLHPYLDKDNHADLIPRAYGKTRKQVEALVASLLPQPARRDFMTRAPISMGAATWPAPASTADDPTLPAGTIGPLPPAQSPQSQQPAISFSFDKIEAVSGERLRLHFDVGSETAKLLERAREVMRHKFPLASFEDIVREALKLLLEERDPEIKLKLEKENAREVLTAGRRVPIWVRRKVWRRDGGRCAYLAEDGTRCFERSGLEYDHVVPYAKGGRSDEPANIRLLCRAHNQLFGALAFPTASA